MTKRSRWQATAASMAALSLTAVVWAGFAWACTAQAHLALIPDSGPAGSNITVTGSKFQPPVEVRWNSTTGPLLATASGSDFTVRVKIPNVPPGVYYIVGKSMTSVYETSSSFEVVGASTGGAGGTSQGQGSSGAGSTGGNTSSGVDGGSSGGTGQTSASADGGSSSAAGGQTAATADGGRTTSTRRAAPSRATAQAPRTTKSAGQAPAPGPAREPTSVVSRSGKSPVAAPDGEVSGSDEIHGARVFADSVAAPPAPAREQGRRGTASQPQVTGMTDDDLWSGFASGAASTMPGQSSAIGQGSSAPGTGTQLLTGIGLLATGLALLSAGGLIAVVGRRRAARASTRR